MMTMSQLDKNKAYARREQDRVTSMQEVGDAYRLLSTIVARLTRVAVENQDPEIGKELKTMWDAGLEGYEGETPITDVDIAPILGKVIEVLGMIEALQAKRPVFPGVPVPAIIDDTEPVVV